jgi:hypothetical protein
LHIIACPFLFFFFLTIALSVLQFTASDYHFVRDRDSMLVIMIEKYLLILRQTCKAWPHHFKKGEVWLHKTSLTPPLFIEVTVPSKENEQSCICVLGVSILSPSTFLRFDLGIVPTVWYFLFSFYLIIEFGYIFLALFLVYSNVYYQINHIYNELNVTNIDLWHIYTFCILLYRSLLL